MAEDRPRRNLARQAVITALANRPHFFINVGFFYPRMYTKNMNELNINNPSRNPYLLIVIIGGLFFVAGQYVASAPQRAQKEAELNREITVQGQGEVTAKPDVAVITLAVQTEILPTAEAASQNLATTFAKVLSAVKTAGVADKDVKTTNLSVNPVYDYTAGKQVPRGYQASESITVSVRAIDTVSDVLGKATAQGVNQVGGISFTIDKPENLKITAQENAIADAKEKASKLAKSLGVSLGKVKTFSISDFPSGPPIYALNAESKAGGGDVSGPPVASGENTVQANVTVTFELK